MKADDVIELKLLKTYPKSWKIFEESCAYSIKNNLNFIKGVLLFEEKKLDYAELSIVGDQVRQYLVNKLGYKIVYTTKDTFACKDGFKEGLVFVAFLSESYYKQWSAEADAYNKWCTDRWGTEPKRTIYNEIKFLNIYKK